MSGHTKRRLAHWQALWPRPGLPTMRGLFRWRSAVAVLWLAVWLLPSFVPPRSAASSLPDCCQGDGAHQCSVRQAMRAAGAPVTVVTVPCDAPRPQVAAGVDLTALHVARFPAKALCRVPREILPGSVDRIPAPVFGVRSSRAPPRLV